MVGVERRLPTCPTPDRKAAAWAGSPTPGGRSFAATMSTCSSSRWSPACRHQPARWLTTARWLPVSRSGYQTHVHTQGGMCACGRCPPVSAFVLQHWFCVERSCAEPGASHSTADGTWGTTIGPNTRDRQPCWPGLASSLVCSACDPRARRATASSDSHGSSQPSARGLPIARLHPPVAGSLMLRHRRPPIQACALASRGSPTGCPKQH